MTKSNLLNIINSPFAGNVIGLISLLVGVLGLIGTVITYFMTKKIEKKLPEAQVHAIDKMHFKEYRPIAITALEVECSNVKEIGKLSRNTCTRMFYICTNILKHKDVLNPEDLKSIENIHDEIKKLAYLDGNYKHKDVIEFIEKTTNLIGILQKGEYDL